MADTALKTALKATTAPRESKAPAVNSLSVIVLGIALVGLLAAPFMVYPIFLMKMLCFALFASAFNLLLGYTGILSFGHAAFFGGAAYITAHTVKVWGVTPEFGLVLGVLAAAALGLVIGYSAMSIHAGAVPRGRSMSASINGISPRSHRIKRNWRL